MSCAWITDLHSLNRIEREEVRLRLHYERGTASHIQDMRRVPVGDGVDEDLM